MDHGLEAHVDLAASDDLGDIGGVIRLEQSDLETFILEVASGLGEVEGGVVRGRMPLRKKQLSQVELIDRAREARKLGFWNNVSVPVGQKSDLVGRHDGRNIKLLKYFNWVSMPRENASSSTLPMLFSVQPMYSIERKAAV